MAATSPVRTARAKGTRAPSPARGHNAKASLRTDRSRRSANDMSARLTLAGPLLVAMVVHAGAAPVAETNALNRKVPLDCQLQQSKIVLITNSTSETISSGTHISFDT